MKKQNKIEVDVMIRDMFYGTFLYEHNPLFKFDIQGVVLEQSNATRHSNTRITIS